MLNLVAFTTSAMVIAAGTASGFADWRTGAADGVAATATAPECGL
jgi:hypothetical protein